MNKEREAIRFPLKCAFALQSEVAKIGFDWSHPLPALQKFIEEWEEFRSTGSVKKQREELGDLFFSWVNVFRLSGGKIESLALPDPLPESSFPQLPELLYEKPRCLSLLQSVLSTLCQIADEHNLEVEAVLMQANKKFFLRFWKMIASLRQAGKDPYSQHLTLNEMDEVWEHFRKEDKNE
ncbi:MAG: hypothetical protein ACK4G3_01040 [bacterium]